MTVQYSIQKMVSDGTLSTIALGIQYLQRNDIYMRIAGEETPQSGAHSGYTWSFLDNTTLKILPVVPNGVEVVVYRRTGVDAMYNVYSQNAQFDEATIDENNQQLLYIAQEYLEQGLPGAGVDTLEYVRDDGSFTYYRMRRTDGSYSEEFAVPSASNSTKVLTREALRRSYAEAGYNLVDGSFEAGGTLVNANDVLLQERTGKAFSGPAGTVAAGTNPASGGFVAQNATTLRTQLSGIDGAGMVGYDEDNEYGVGTVGGELNSIASISPPVLVQKRMCEPVLGFNNGTTDTQIFPNAQTTSQGLAYANVAGVEKIFVLQPVVTGSNLVTERHRIVEFNFADDGSALTHVAYSNELSIGHQHISAIVLDGTAYIYGAMTTQAGHEGNDAGKGYSKTQWLGASTSQANVTNYQLWGYAGSGHRFEGYYGGWSAVSPDGKYVVLVGSDVTAGGETEDTVSVMFVYDRVAVESAADPLTVDPLFFSPLATPNEQRSQYNQGVACDGEYVYITRGYYGPLLQHIVQKFNMLGELVQEISVDDARAKYGIEALLDHPTQGTPASFEPEGIALRPVGGRYDILLLSMDFWRAGAPIVSYLGENWASIKPNNLGFSPENELYWVLTKKAATHGAWDPLVTYDFGTNHSYRAKVVYAIRQPQGDAGEEQIARGLTNKESGASLNSRSSAVDIAFRYGDDFQIKSYSENTRRYYNAASYRGRFVFGIHDQRPGSDNTKSSYISAQFPPGREFMEIRARDSGLVNGAGITLYGANDASSPGKAIIHTRSATTNWEWHALNNGIFRANTDVQQDIGAAANRCLNVFAQRFRTGDGSTHLTSCVGTPEGQVTSPVGSLCIRTDGTTGVRLYWKNTGTGNTGWVAIL